MPRTPKISIWALSEEDPDFYLRKRAEQAFTVIMGQIGNDWVLVLDDQTKQFRAPGSMLVKR
jgi:hypothetical protein